jgi:hypothetical protein
MIYPAVTERHKALEPTERDTFIDGLLAPSPPPSAPLAQVIALRPPAARPALRVA